MKALRILLALLLWSPLHLVHAQIEERALMSVDIPFAFTAGSTHLPAGHYIVYSELDHAWRLSSFRYGGNAFIHVLPESTHDLASRPRMVFYREQSKYVLREIVDTRSGVRATLPEKPGEQPASGASAPEIATVYAADGAPGR